MHLIRTQERPTCQDLTEVGTRVRLPPARGPEAARPEHAPAWSRRGLERPRHQYARAPPSGASGLMPASAGACSALAVRALRPRPPPCAAHVRPRRGAHDALAHRLLRRTFGLAAARTTPSPTASFGARSARRGALGGLAHWRLGPSAGSAATPRRPGFAAPRPISASASRRAGRRLPACGPPRTPRMHSG
jgi:hypothetical protein